MSRFDLCVIGSGPAGQKAAIQAAKLGKRVCVVEKREDVGGVALHTGTIPSKALREAILDLGGRSMFSPTAEDFRAARHKTFVEISDSTDSVIRAETDEDTTLVGYGFFKQVVTLFIRDPVMAVAGQLFRSYLI